MMNPLPDDAILYNILPRLPTKSLLRFSCVCKFWHSFIRHPSFLLLRRSLNPTLGHLLFVCPSSAVSCSEPHVFSAPLLQGQSESDVPPPRATHIATVSNRASSEVDVQCVNGLLCLHPKDSSRSEAFTQICNPTTRQIITLPDDPSMRNESRVSTHFGYDPIRDLFKVVRLLKYGNSYVLKIFTVGDANNSWRRVTPAMPNGSAKWFSEPKRGICVSGAIHWRYSSFIMVFDLGNEQFRVINIPHGYSYRERMTPYLKFPDLVELGGCLSLIGYRGSALNLWILKDYETQEWIQKSITLPCGIGAQERAHFPLCKVLTTGEILLFPYFVARRVKVIYHNMEKMSSRTAMVMEMLQPLWPDQRSGDLNIFYYQENFISLK